MAKEESIPKEEEKLDIEDIKGPEDLDIEEAVSEPEEAEEKTPEIEPKEVEKEEPKVEEEKKDDKDILEKAVSDTETEVKEDKIEEKEAKPKKSKWMIALIVFVTVLITAVIVLGVVYWLTVKNQTKTEEVKTEEPAVAETTTDETTVTTDKSVYVNATDGLRLRKEPNPNAEILDTMPFGTKLTPLATSGDWIKVEYNGKTGWCMSSYTSATTPLVYKNSDYGFQITFPANWATYKLIPTKAEAGVTAGYYVALATTDTTYTDSSLEKGYDSLFAISIYTLDQWAAAQPEEGPKPTLAVKNNKYVIAYSLPNGIPAKDMEARAKEAKTVIDTIKFY